MTEARAAHSPILTEIAQKAMLEHGFMIDFPSEVTQETAAISLPVLDIKPSCRDMRERLWISIDNDDSMDLDQLTYAEITPDGQSKIFVAIADVAELVARGSFIDAYAMETTTSVYTPTKVFPMLPLRLSTDLSSLNEKVDRRAIVVEMDLESHGKYHLCDIYPAWVNNCAKLTYNLVAACLENNGLPTDHPGPQGLFEQIALQNRLAQKIKAYRQSEGALSFGTQEVVPRIVEGIAVGLEATLRNLAKELIENFMIASNVCVTNYLDKYKLPVIRRIVQQPKRWERIVSLASELGYVLPSTPDVKALSGFLQRQQLADPVRFNELSLSVIKLLGRGEYVVGLPGQLAPGHFDLALRDYAHTTAPNRRYPDLVMQRLLKSQFQGAASPYSNLDLSTIARHCTLKEDDASKVQRRVLKSAAAMVLASQIGQQFQALVTGVNENGTWVRLLNPPIEGKLISGFKGLDVGHFLNVKLVGVDVPNGFIDFAGL